METIFTTMDCGVITHSLDGTRLLGINQAALDILGYDSAEDLMAAGFDMVAPSVVDEDAGKMRESIATLKNVGDSVSTEYRVRHDNGDIVHVMGNVKLIESAGELLLQRYPARLHGQEKGRSAQGAAASAISSRRFPRTTCSYAPSA